MIRLICKECGHILMPKMQAQSLRFLFSSPCPHKAYLIPAESQFLSYLRKQKRFLSSTRPPNLSVEAKSCCGSSEVSTKKGSSSADEDRSSRNGIRFLNWKLGAFLSLSIAGGGIILRAKKSPDVTIHEITDSIRDQQTSSRTNDTIEESIKAGTFRPELPTYSLKEISDHNNEQTGVWVTFQSGVYDITEFVESHPGGDRIMLAAGGSIEPFWDLYAQHKCEEVFAILEELRVGNLNQKEVKELEESRISADDPFAAEPKRHPALIARSAKPFNAEVPSSLVTLDFHTPNELFFVRNHLPVPKTDASTHQLTITGEYLKKDVNLSLEELKSKFHPVTITACIQCAGNQRAGMSKVKNVKGLSWGHTAISNATWTGVRLKDVLENAGLKLSENSSIKHVQFEGMDKDMTGQCYGASIPVEKAMHPDTILAFEMNGKPLPRDHGYPLRVIVPGVAGARQVKWLSKITVSSEESPSLWQQRDYRVFAPGVDGDSVNYQSAPSIQDFPITSAICKPQDGQKFDNDQGSLEVEGYAFSGGGQGIIRVDVSADGGKTWQTADLNQAAGQTWYNMYAWTLWKTEIAIPQRTGNNDNAQLELVCKATNVSYNTQPESPAGIWNFRGLLNNSWHRVRVVLE